MSPENFDKLLKEGSKVVPIDRWELVHSPEFEEFIKDEPWDEYEKEDFQ